ncbi:MAG: HAMP domain-containing histidine kinase [Deltaproteobacteria bacterium]|uniref:histidine kinase n=1 Tax=Candidatus Zymogenus saltonus TaxID=2844893 RepID=A0A9D8KD55_9DELT|nr:HAMP domain-containing histidine kinase [Candidatus Zymogenus saltonus]
MDRLRVLVVDDELGMCLGIERALKDFAVTIPDLSEEVRFDIDKALTGNEALSIIEAKPPHIILLDYRLPDMLGSDILETLKADKRTDILVIIITAFASIETAIETIKLGAYDFLAKPFTPDDLRNVLRKAAGRLILQRKAKSLLMEKRQIRFQFISVLAHELKSPLNAIEGYLGIMRDRKLGEEIDKYDRMIERCIIRISGMRKLIFDLLDLTRIESGQKKRSFEKVDLCKVAVDSIEMMSNDAKAQKIDIEMKSKGPIILTGVRDEVEIIFNNLISNAVKYNKEGGKVTVDIGLKDNIAKIRVTDTGIGMSSDEAAKIFDDFVRIKNSKTKNIMGSGLGLSTVKKLVVLYKGNVSVTSKEDKGSTFTVTLRTDLTPESESDIYDEGWGLTTQGNIQTI